MMISLYGEQPGRDKEAAKTVRSKQREALSTSQFDQLTSTDQFDQLAEPVELTCQSELQRVFMRLTPQAAGNIPWEI